jgi:hypothetical protein
MNLFVPFVLLCYTGIIFLHTSYVHQSRYMILVSTFPFWHSLSYDLLRRDWQNSTFSVLHHVQYVHVCIRIVHNKGVSEAQRTLDCSCIFKKSEKDI